jgi:hypothetical protein
MKNHLAFVRHSLMLLVLVTIGVSCDAPTKTDPVTAGGCLLQRIDTESKSAVTNTKTQTVYTYDDGQNLTRTVYTLTSNYIGIGSKTDFSITTDYIYTSDGYLLAINELTNDQTTNTSGQVILVKRTAKTTYAYNAGRVASYTTISTNNEGKPSTRTGTYAYDPATEQVRQTESDSPTFTRVYTYTKGALTDYVERNGATESRPWELKNGVITRYTIPGGLVITYQYDDQLRPIRRDEFVNGKQTEYTTWTNDTAKPGTAAQPVQKGFPDLVPTFGRAGVIRSEKKYFINGLTGQTQFYSDQETSSQANSQGFVTRRSGTTQFQNPSVAADMNTTTTETYTYINCP